MVDHRFAKPAPERVSGFDSPALRHFYPKKVYISQQNDHAHN
jgi:hypothetical protein